VKAANGGVTDRRKGSARGGGAPPNEVLEGNGCQYARTANPPDCNLFRRVVPTEADVPWTARNPLDARCQTKRTPVFLTASDST
jgi:hypothetical protein